MRVSGKTTRLIDNAIQILFNGDKLLIPTNKDKIRDPLGIRSLFDTEFENKYNLKIILDIDWEEGYAQENMLRRLLRRLEIEHGLILAHKDTHYYGYIIELKDFKNLKR